MRRSLFFVACAASAVFILSSCQSAQQQFDRAETLRTGSGLLEANATGAFGLYLSAAKSGHLGAQVALGRAYEFGEGVAQDGDRAVKWYETAAAKKSLEAQEELGRAYAQGVAFPRDYVKSVAWFSAASDRGSPVAQHALGVEYLLGWGVSRDDARGAELVRQAAEAGNVAAQTAMGDLTSQGVGVGKSLTGACDWYARAANRSNPDPAARARLGRSYAEGQCPAPDADAAARWLKRAAEDGHADAQDLLGRMYAEGRGIAQNSALSKSWLEKAADQGHPDARWRLGGMPIFSQSGASAVLLEPLASSGQISAQMLLGLAYFLGEGVARDDAKAAAWLQKASLQGADAQAALSLMYLAGEGVARDERRAAQLLGKALGITGAVLATGSVEPAAFEPAVDVARPRPRPRR